MEYTPKEWIKDNLVTNKKIKKLADAIAELSQRIQGVIPQPTAEDDGKTVIADHGEWVIGDFPTGTFDCTITVTESGFSCDTSIEDIVEMLRNGIEVYGVATLPDSTVVKVPILLYHENPATVFVSFATPADNIAYGVTISGLVGTIIQDADTWITIDTFNVPAIYNSDNGKMLVAEVKNENGELVKSYKLKKIGTNEIISIDFGTNTAIFGTNADGIISILSAGNTPIFKNISSGVSTYYYLFKSFVLDIGSTRTFYMILCNIDGAVDDIYSAKNIHFKHIQFTDDTAVANCEDSALIPDFTIANAGDVLKVNVTGTGLVWENNTTPT